MKDRPERSRRGTHPRDQRPRHRRAIATFAEDAYVNDNRREFVGIDAIRRWVAKEMVGDKVKIDVREVLDHYGDTWCAEPTTARSTGPICPTRLS